MPTSPTPCSARWLSRPRLAITLALTFGCSSPGPSTVDVDADIDLPTDDVLAVDLPWTPTADAPAIVDAREGARDASAPSDVAMDLGAPSDVAVDLDAPSDVAVDLGAPSTPDVPQGIDRPTATGGCVPTVAVGHENTDALCANGLDDDCNGYIDCRDFRCSRLTPAVTVCRSDAGPGPMDVPAVADVPRAGMDAAGGAVGPMGGTVARLRFGVFGDVRPPSPNNTSMYPTAIVTAVMDGIAASGAQFAVANGDYMFATTASNANAQVGMLLGAEAHFGGHVFHSLGNHECGGATASNCPVGNETAQMQVYRARLASAYAAPYFDWVVRTELGDAHFIATAPNAWSPTQQAWLNRALAAPALYTIIIAHEPAGRRQAPGSVAIENSFRARPGGVTLRLYGHTHEYQHQLANAIIVGNAGAPLASASGQYGFVVVDQRADRNLVVTAYSIGRPPMVVDTFVLTPGGGLTR